jgi:hypothetical protein
MESFKNKNYEKNHGKLISIEPVSSVHSVTFKDDVVGYR